uniref:Uncharacterized protein n=1 Tax=Leucosporidium scottii TaxID=5278 RepID=A0A0H5FT60_9BASI|nr:hypothetical protein [Leucosporidium scottii]
MKDWSTLALGAVLGLAAPVWGMQASDVGLFDWHLPLIGPPQLASPQDPPPHRFHHTSTSLAPNASKKSLLLTYTRNNVLAALEPSTGDVGELTLLLSLPSSRRQTPTADRSMYISLQSGDVAIPPIIPALAISLAPPPDRKDFKAKLYAGATVLLLISSGSPRMACGGLEG